MFEREGDRDRNNRCSQSALRKKRVIEKGSVGQEVREYCMIQPCSRIAADMKVIRNRGGNK